MPFDKDDAALVAIRDNIVLANAFVDDLDPEAFREDRKSFYAATRCLEIISEASRRLSDDLKGRHPSLPWSQIASAGNIYRHKYDNVLETFVWNTVKLSLPTLLLAIDQELSGSGG